MLKAPWSCLPLFHDIAITDFSGASKTVRTTLYSSGAHSGAHVQLMAPESGGRSDTYTTAPTSGTTVDCSEVPFNKFTMQVTGTGATPTSWTVVLQGSLDNVTFTDLMSHDNALDANGAIKMSSSMPPVKYFRSRVTALVLGSATNIVVVILGQAGF